MKTAQSQINERQRIIREISEARDRTPTDWHTDLGSIMARIREGYFSDDIESGIVEAWENVTLHKTDPDGMIQFDDMPREYVMLLEDYDDDAWIQTLIRFYCILIESNGIEAEVSPTYRLNCIHTITTPAGRWMLVLYTLDEGSIK